jgi:hypothetical protein
MATKQCEQTLSSPAGPPLPDARTTLQVGFSTGPGCVVLVGDDVFVRLMPPTTTTLGAAGCQSLLAQLIAALAATLAMGAPAQAQSMLDQIILQKCSAAMQADFAKAGQTPPSGLVQQTCSCVVQQMQATHNLDLAKTVCSQQAGATSS